MEKLIESVNWKVEGMTCSNCALTVSKFLEKEGMQNIKVNPIDGDVHFDTAKLSEGKQQKLTEGIASLGYTVVDDHRAFSKDGIKTPMNKHLRYLLICLPFTALLMTHMIPGLHIHWLMNPWVQLGLCIPVYITGMAYFGKSAINSLRIGSPNMNVLIAIGATAAFI